MIPIKIKPSRWLGSFSFTSRIGLTAVILLGFGLRLVRLDFQPLWWDEGWSLFFATRDFGVLLDRTAVDIHPPLYYALLKAWIMFGGQGEIAMRLFSVAVGVATIPLIYALGKRLFGSRVALVSALVVAIAPLHIYYSQEVRMYGLVTLLGLASVYLFVELLWQSPNSENRSRTFRWLLYVIVTAAALYTEYYAAFILGVQVVVVAIGSIRLVRTGQPIRPMRQWLVAWLAIAGLYLPWVVYAGPKLYTYVISKVTIEQYQPLDPLTYLAQHFVTFSVGHLSAWTWLAAFSLVLVLLCLLGILWAQKNESSPRFGACSPRSIAVLYLLVPLVLGYGVNLFYPFHPVHTERLLLLASPAFYLLGAAGVLALSERRRLFGFIAMAVVAAICAASLYDFYAVPRYPNDDYRPAIANIQRLAQPGDVLLAVHPWQIGYLESYYDGAPLTTVETPSADWIRDSSQLERSLDTLLAEHGRVWLPAYQPLGHVLESAVEDYLRPRTYAVLDTWQGTTRLELFATAQEPSSTNRSLELGPNLGLSDYSVLAGPVAAGQGILPIKLNWSEPVPTGYSASLRLVDAQGYVWAQDDRGIESGEQRIGFVVPIGTPPGMYDLRLIAYREKDKAQNDVTLGRVSIIAPKTVNIASSPHRLSLPLGDGIQLVGYEIGDKPLRPGDMATVTLYWQTQHALDNDYTVVVQVADDRGNVFARAESPPARGIYPTSQWQPNEIVRDPQSIALRGDTPDGNLHLIVGLSQAGNSSLSNQRIANAIQVKGRPHYLGAPSPTVTSDLRFGDVARLAGYDVDQENETVHLVLYWQATSPTSTSFKVFVHILDNGGNIASQGDQIPGGGAFPTTGWVKGEYLVDEYWIPVPSGQLAEIAVGMYDMASSARLPVLNASNQPLGDHIVLPMRIK